MTLQQIKQKQEELEQMIAELESQPDEPGMKYGDDYLYLDDSGDDRIGVNKEQRKDLYRLSIGNCFKTKEYLEKYKLRIESMKPKYLPEIGDEFFTISFRPDGSMFFSKFTNRRGGFLTEMEYLLGRTFRTEKEAKDWLEKYQDAWRL